MTRSRVEPTKEDRLSILPEVDDKAVEKVQINNSLAPSAPQLVTCRHWLVWPACFLFMTAYNLNIVTFGQYSYIKLEKQMIHNVTINTTKSLCVEDTDSLIYKRQLDVQQAAAAWTIYFYLSGGITSIFANFILGSLTDRFGRKFLFILPCIGALIRTSGTIIGVHYNLPLYYSLFFCFIESVTGQVFAVFQFGFMYVSDITPAGKNRSKGIVAVELAFGLGTILPNLLVGYTLKITNNFIIPFIVSVIVMGTALLLAFVIPETYPKEMRQKRTYTSKLENLKDSVDLYISQKNAGRRWMYAITLMIFSLTTYDLLGRAAMETLFLMNTPLCWAPDKLGIFGALKSGFQQFAGMILVVVFHLFTTDEVIAAVGCLSFGAAFVMEAFATTDAMMYAVTAVGCCGLLTIPMIRSIMSQMTSSNKQGAVFASIAVAETTVSLLSAVTANSVYIATVRIMRGFTFLMFAAFNLISFILVMIFIIGTRRSGLKYLHLKEDT